MDFTSIVKNDFLRFLYSIILPGIIISIVPTLIVFCLINNLNIFYDIDISKKYFILFVFTVLTFIGGLLIEVLGVYIESNFIDTYVACKIGISETDFINLWNKYLFLKTDNIKQLILDDYYRSILTKLKFLINLSISLVASYLFILFSLFVFEINIFHYKTLQGFKSFILLGIVIFIISAFLFRRAKYCGLLLFEARRQMLTQIALY